MWDSLWGVYSLQGMTDHNELYVWLLIVIFKKCYKEKGASLKKKNLSEDATLRMGTEGGRSEGKLLLHPIIAVP